MAGALYIYLSPPQLYWNNGGLGYALSVAIDASGVTEGTGCFNVYAPSGGFLNGPSTVTMGEPGSGCDTSYSDAVMVDSPGDFTPGITSDFENILFVPPSVFVYQFTIALAVSFPATVAPGGTITITIDSNGQGGGQDLTVNLSDGGAGGSFSQPSVQVSDGSGNAPATATVNYTAPATPGTMTFDFNGRTADSLLTFNYSPATLTVAAADAGKAAGFLTFFE